MPVPEFDEPLSIATDLRPAPIRGVIRDGFAVGVLLIVAGFVSVLPGAGRELPGTDLAVGALLSAAVALAVVVATLLATSSVGALVEAVLEGPPDVVGDLAAAARYALAFVAVLVAHRGLSPVVVPLLAPGSVWVYDVAFLGFALFPVAAITRRLYRNADAVAEDLAAAAVGTTGSDGGDAVADGSGDY